MSRKAIQRLLIIASNAIRSFSLPLVSALISILIIRFTSRDLWGEMTGYLILASLLAHISSFGSKELLLRSFSKSPSGISDLWFRSLSSRHIILIMACGALFIFPFSSKLKVYIMLILIARHVVQSYDPVLTYKKKFSISLLSEGISLTLFSLLVSGFKEQLDIERVLLFYTFGELAKAFMLWLVFRREFPLTVKLTFDRTYIIQSLPFFVLGFSGMLQSKADQLSVLVFLDRAEVGEYQVLTNFFYMIMAIPGLSMNTYLKNFYRVKDKGDKNLNLSFLKFGLIFIPAALLCVYLVLHLIYEFNTGWKNVLIGFFYILPTYYYTPFIYQSFKDERTSPVVILTFSGIALNWLLSVFIVPVYGFSGALASAVSAQWMVLICYFYIFRNSKMNDLALIRK